MKILKNLSFLLVIIYFSGFSAGNSIGVSNMDYIPKEMQTGEVITYIAQYSFIKFGEVKLMITEQKNEKGEVYYKTKAHIDSYSGIPFVDLHQVYESTLNKNFFSEYFRATEREKNYMKFTEYFFDNKKHTVHIKKGKYNPFQVWADSTTRIKSQCQDGLSLFYYARMNTGQRKTVDVPCFVTEKFENTHINFYDKIEKSEAKPVNYKISSVRLDGHTDFVSIFGLTGNFEGWFTNDKYAVPTIAMMKVIIGNISLELKEWKKANWAPPIYK